MYTATAFDVALCIFKISAPNSLSYARACSHVLFELIGCGTQVSCLASRHYYLLDQILPLLNLEILALCRRALPCAPSAPGSGYAVIHTDPYASSGTGEWFSRCWWPV